MEVPYFKFNHHGRELELVKEVLDSGWLTTAGKTLQFEKQFAEICNASHALAVNSCTAALHLGLEALGIGPGDLVAVPSLTFTATAEVVRYMNADILPVDCDAETGLMDVRHLQKIHEQHPNLKACIVVHYAGQSAEMIGENGLWDYCKAHGIRLMVDAAHAFPASDVYGPVGSIGDVTCFSFYANKTITTGEGGMLVTNNDEIASRVKVMRLHGISRDIWDRFTDKNASWDYDVIAPGYKYNMPDINAAIGLAQLEKADDFRTSRQKVAEQYLDGLEGVSGLRALRMRVLPEQHAWHLFPIVLTEQSKLSRDEMVARLKEDKIGTSVHYRPIHRMTYYRERYDLKADDYPNTESIWSGCLSLPLYPQLTERQVNYVLDRIKFHLG